jgi:ABC-type dipeptide/oligopeptide/nickel transport system permease component
MTLTTLILTLATFLFSVIIGALALMVAGIRSDGRARNLTNAPRSHTAAVTRWLLGVDVRGTEAGSESRDEHS